MNDTQVNSSTSIDFRFLRNILGFLGCFQMSRKVIYERCKSHQPEMSNDLDSSFCILKNIIEYKRDDKTGRTDTV